MGKGFMQFATGALSGFNENSEMEYKRIADLDRMRVQTIQQRAMEFDKERSAYSNKIGSANQALKSLVDGGVDPRIANRAIEMWLSTGDKKYIDPATVHASFKVEEVADPKSFKPSPGEGETHQLVQPGQASAFRAPIPQAPDLDAMVRAGGRTHLRPGDVNAYKAMFNTEGLPNLERAPEPQTPYAIRYVSPEMQARTRAFGLEALRTVVNMAKDFEGLRNPDTALTLWQKLTGITDPRFFPPREAFAALSSYRSEGSAREKEMSQRINATALFIQERFGKSPEQAKKEAMQLVYGVGVDITSDGELVGKGEVKDANKLKINGELATAQITADINRLGFTPQNAEAYHQALTSLGPNEQRNWRLNEATKTYERINSNVRQAETTDAKKLAGKDAINRAAEMAGGLDKLSQEQIAALEQLPPGTPFKLVPGGIEVIKGGGTAGGITPQKQAEIDATAELLATKFGFDIKEAKLVAQATPAVRNMVLATVKDMSPQQVTLVRTRVNSTVKNLFQGGTNSNVVAGIDSDIEIRSLSPEFQEALNEVTSRSIANGLRLVKQGGNAVDIERETTNVFNSIRDKAIETKIYSLHNDAQKLVTSGKDKRDVPTVHKELVRKYMDQLSPSGKKALEKILLKEGDDN